MPFPLIDFSIFRNPAFSSGVLAAAMMMFALGGIQLVTTQRFQLVAGYSPLEAGLLVSAAAIGSLPTALLGGALLHRAGMAASVEEVSYEFGGLLAVAILGSLLSALYTLGIALPEGAPVEARDNIATALTLAAGDTANGPALVAAASAAFDNAYLVVMYVGAALLAAGAIVTGVLLRRYGPGSQSSLYPSSH